MFYLEDFVKIIQNQDIEFQDIDKSLKILKSIKEYQRISNFDLIILNQFIDLLKTLNQTMSFYLILKKKKILNKYLELFEILQKSGDFKAEIEIINDLEKLVKNNKKQLKFLKEDYSYLKNQRDKINNTIQDYKLVINSINKKIHEYKNQIDRLTTEMEDGIYGVENPEFKDERPRSERIQTSQRYIRDLNYEIKQNKSKIDKAQIELDKINPFYEKLNNDYQTLRELLNENAQQLTILKRNLLDKLDFGVNMNEQDNSFIELNWLKSTNEIEEEIQILNSKLRIISKFLNIKIDQPQFNLLNFIDESKKIEEIIVSKQKELNILNQDDEVIEYIKHFRKIENLINNLENIMNKFLIQIDLLCTFNIVVNDENNNFKIQLSFIRTKEIVEFLELTTPEKIFFVITFYLSIKVLLKSYNIIFSNKFLSNEYNKRGSVYRTIRKVLPVFETDKELEDFNLIFVISSLEMKKPIKNIKIVNVDEEDNGKE